MIVSTAPMNVAPTAGPIELDPSICEPIHSHSSGVPIHSTRLPRTMIRTTSTAPRPVLSTSVIGF